MYRQSLQYYMQMQQMQMNYPPYMSAYGMNPEQYNNAMMKPGYSPSNPHMQESQAQQPQPQNQPSNQNSVPVGNPGIGNKQLVSENSNNNTGYRIEIAKQTKSAASLKDPNNTCTKSVEEYE